VTNRRSSKRRRGCALTLEAQHRPRKVRLGIFGGPVRTDLSVSDDSLKTRALSIHVGIRF